jgi:hypothetical protein
MLALRSAALTQRAASRCVTRAAAAWHRPAAHLQRARAWRVAAAMDADALVAAADALHKQAAQLNKEGRFEGASSWLPRARSATLC